MKFEIHRPNVHNNGPPGSRPVIGDKVKSLNTGFGYDPRRKGSISDKGNLARMDERWNSENPRKKKLSGSIGRLSKKEASLLGRIYPWRKEELREGTNHARKKPKPKGFRVR